MKGIHLNGWLSPRPDRGSGISMGSRRTTVWFCVMMGEDARTVRHKVFLTCGFGQILGLDSDYPAGAERPPVPVTGPKPRQFDRRSTIDQSPVSNPTGSV